MEIWFTRMLLLIMAGPWLAAGQQRPEGCPDYGTLLYEVAHHCLLKVVGPFGWYEGNNAQSVDHVLATDLFLKSFCIGLEELQDCILESGGEYWGECSEPNKLMYAALGRSDALRTQMKSGLYLDADQICDGPNLSDEISSLYSRVDDDDYPVCANDDDIQRCLQPWLEETTHWGGSVPNSLEDQLLAKWAESTYRCLTRRVQDLCDVNSQDLLFFVFNQTIPHQIRDNLILKNGSSSPASAGIFSMSRRSTVGVFGDPHLKIYKGASFVTCAAESTTEYLDHPRLKMRGKNTKINSRSPATFLTEINIDILDERGYKVVGYEASSKTTGPLPTTLDNGQTSFATDAGNITLLASHGSVIILIEPLAAVFVIANHSFGATPFYRMVARMGDVLFDQAGGLLINGCGHDDRLNRNNVLSRRRKRSVTDEACQDVCSEAVNDGDFNYRDTCYFDCTTTQDTQMGLVSMTFAESLDTILEEDKRLPLIEESVTTPEPSNPPTGEASNSRANSTILCFLVVRFCWEMRRYMQ